MSLNIHQRIHAVMSELDYIQKSERKVNGQYRFVSHDDVTAKIHPMLVKHGIVIESSVYNTKQDGNRTEVYLNVRFVNIDKPEDQFSVNSIGYGIDSSDKGPGKAISYAFKYAILKTFCLETGDDPDQDQNTHYEPPKCQEFDSAIPDTYDLEDVKSYVKITADRSDKPVEDVKREAVAKLDNFLKAYTKWRDAKLTKSL